MMTVLFKFTRYGAVCATMIVGLGLAAGCANSPVRPSEANIAGSETSAQPPSQPQTQSTTATFPTFDPATLTLTIATTTASSVGQPYIDQGKIKLEILVDSTGKAVPCGTPGATYVRFDTFLNGGKNPAAALTSTAVDLDNLATTTEGLVQNVACGDEICIRVHYVTGGGNTKVLTHWSADTPYTIVCPLLGGCTLSQGYWKNHSGWPVNGLTLGTVYYTPAELLNILGEEPKKGNGLVSLAHQLIAAKLNIANGASPSAIASAIATADALIGGLIVPPTGTDFLPSSTTSALTQTLDDYNIGVTGPGHCEK
jgi:hypothetical protein